jgi:hypothetical protein
MKNIYFRAERIFEITTPSRKLSILKTRQVSCSRNGYISVDTKFIGIQRCRRRQTHGRAYRSTRRATHNSASWTSTAMRVLLVSSLSTLKANDGVRVPQKVQEFINKTVQGVTKDLLMNSD